MFFNFDICQVLHLRLEQHLRESGPVPDAPMWRVCTAEVWAWLLTELCKEYPYMARTTRGLECFYNPWIRRDSSKDLRVPIIVGCDGFVSISEEFHRQNAEGVFLVEDSTPYAVRDLEAIRHAYNEARLNNFDDGCGFLRGCRVIYKKTTDLHRQAPELRLTVLNYEPIPTQSYEIPRYGGVSPFIVPTSRLNLLLQRTNNDVTTYSNYV